MYPGSGNSKADQGGRQSGHHGLRTAQKSVALREVRHQALYAIGVNITFLARPLRVGVENVVYREAAQILKLFQLPPENYIFLRAV